MARFRAADVASLRGLAVMAAAALLMLGACNRLDSDWRSAQAADTAEGYEQFISRHPDSREALVARERILQLAEQLDWDKAVLEDTVEAYTRFMVQHPGSRWSEEARARILNYKPEAAGGDAATTPAEEAAAAAAAAATPAPIAKINPVPRTAEPAVAAPSPVSEAKTKTLPGTPPKQRSAAPPPASDGAYAVQLGAYSSEARANQAWRELSERHSQFLRDAVPQVSPVDTSSGKMFRLRTPVRDGETARDLCERLRKAGTACLVTRG
ncbi:MAG: SPOR domain-containing protein [Steroidobacteraceae bacterium]